MKIGLGLAAAIPISYLLSETYLLHRNNLDYQQILELERDTSRAGYKSYGLNYGFKTDQAIEEVVDTGDMLVLQYDCWKSLEAGRMRRCVVTRLMQRLQGLLDTEELKRKKEVDAVALVVRDLEGPRVISQCFGDISDQDYEDFISAPYLSTISLRKLKTHDLKMGYVGKEFVASLEPAAYTPWTRNDGVQVILSYLSNTGLINQKLQKDDLSAWQLASGKVPLVDASLGKYMSTLIIRTELSRLDLKNY